jgi:hypothetical protein
MFSLLSKARSPPLVNFKHYGHPIRDRRSVGLGDRGREIALMALVYLFALYFPSGFVALIWMEPVVQYLWLGYQIYAILAMHVVRIAGWGGSRRIEECIARNLESGKEVWLLGENGHAVAAKLETAEVDSIVAGRKKIREIVDRHLALWRTEGSPARFRNAFVQTEAKVVERVL